MTVQIKVVFEATDREHSDQVRAALEAEGFPLLVWQKELTRLSHGPPPPRMGYDD